MMETWLRQRMSNKVSSTPFTELPTRIPQVETVSAERTTCVAEKRAVDGLQDIKIET